MKWKKRNRYDPESNLSIYSEVLLVFIIAGILVWILMEVYKMIIPYTELDDSIVMLGLVVILLMVATWIIIKLVDAEILN